MHYYTFSVPLPFFFSYYYWHSSIELFYLLVLQDGVKINTSRGERKPHVSSHRGDIFCSQWWHQHVYKTNEITRLSFFEWVEEGFRVRMWRKVKERLYGFHVQYLWQLCFQVKQREHLRAVMHEYEFVSWSQLDKRHRDTEGKGLWFRELIGNAMVSPLNPCIYALLMKCDSEWAAWGRECICSWAG